MEEPEFCILTPVGCLGYGYRLDEFWYGIEHYHPAAIILDSGSTDAGPYILGMQDTMMCGYESYIRDLTPILEAAFYRKIKVMISSACGDGSNKHVEALFSMTQEIARSRGFSFKVATISTAIDRNTIKSRVLNGESSPCGPLDHLKVEDVDKAVEIVAQMGAEPFLAALAGNPDIILAGRSYDPAPFAAFCLKRGVEPGVAWHMGKIVECGAQCALPKGRSIVATIRKSSFDLTPLSPLERCTRLSVAAHTLYEKTRPDRLPGPGGVLHLSRAHYQQLSDGRTVRVSGAEFIPTPTYQVKLEGVERLGHRTIFIGGIRDPILISQIDDFLEKVRCYVRNLFPELDQSDGCRLICHIYGKNAIMGPLETATVTRHEIGIMGEVVAPNKEKSHAIANAVRTSILHFPYEGQLATAGNFASPLAPQEQDAGEVFRFNIYHLIDLKPGEEVGWFPISQKVIDTHNKPCSEPVRLHAMDKDYFTKSKPLPIVKKTVPHGEAQMKDIAKVIRSKNSGPFEVTFDIMFDDEASYERVKSAGVLTNDTIKRLFRVTDEDIITNMFFQPALAWKCTLRRPWPQGSIGERDTLGAQQYAPLLWIKVPSAAGHPSMKVAAGVPERASIRNLLDKHPEVVSAQEVEGITSEVADGPDYKVEQIPIAVRV